MRYILALLIALQAAAETPISAPRVGPAVGDQSRVRMAVSGDRIFAAWADNRGTRRFDDLTVYASLIDSDGRFLTPQGFIVSEGSASVSHAVVAINDRFVVAWLTATGVHARAYDRDGNALTPPRLLLTVRSGDRDGGALRADAAVAGSRILITTGVPLEPLLLLDQDLRVVAGIKKPMQQVSIASDGTSFLAINAYVLENAMRVETDGRVTVLASNPSLDRRFPPRRLIWTGRDYVLVSADGEHPYRAYAVRYDKDGRQISRQTLSEGFTVDADADVASPGDGSVLTTWSEWPYDIHVAPLTQTPRRRLFSAAPSSTERYPAMVWTGSRYLVAWTDDGDLVLAFADRDGNRVAEGQGRLESFTEQRNAVSTTGVASEWVAWQEIDGQTSRVWIGNALRDGGTTIALPVSDAGGPQTLPRLATSGDQLLAVWLEGTSVLARRFTMAGAPIDVAPVAIASAEDCFDLAAIWDGGAYLIAYMDGGEVWLSRLHRFGPPRASSLIYPDRLTRFPASIAIASSGEGSLVVITERPQCLEECEKFVLTVSGVLLDRNGGLADTRLLTIARGKIGIEHPSDTQVVWSDGAYVLVWRGVPLSGGDKLLYAGRVDANGAVDQTPTVLVNSRSQSFFMPTLVATATGVTVTAVEWPGKLLTLKLTSQLKPLSASTTPFAESNARVVARPTGEPVILYHRLDPTLGVIRAFVRE